MGGCWTNSNYVRPRLVEIKSVQETGPPTLGGLLKPAWSQKIQAVAHAHMASALASVSVGVWAFAVGRRFSGLGIRDHLESFSGAPARLRRKGILAHGAYIEVTILGPIASDRDH